MKKQATKSTKPYELWGTRGLMGSYGGLQALKKAWAENGQMSLAAYHIVGDQKININEKMPQREAVLTEFRTSKERDDHIIKNAAYFTIVRFLGVGQYERHEKNTLEEAVSLGLELSKSNKANYMVYAVAKNERSAFVQNIIYRR